MNTEPRYVKIIKICALYVFPLMIVGLATAVFLIPVPEKTGLLKGFVRGIKNASDVTLIIYSQGNKLPFAQIKPNPNGEYSIELTVGAYAIAVPATSTWKSPDLPKTIAIAKNRTLRLDIGINSQ